MSLIDAALSLLRKGKPVFPVDQTKKPLVAWKQYQDQVPTRQEVTSCWTQWPEANIGMATGRLSGLMVVDCDSEEAAKRFIESYPEARRTLQAQTGRGAHFYFCFEDGITNDAGKLLGPGIDIRGQGGFVIVPPSIHANGKAYQWLNRNEPLPLPSKLREILVTRSKTAPPSNGENGYRERFNTAEMWEGVPEGERDNKLFRYACSLRSLNTPRDVAEELVLKAASRCEPPFPEREALEKISNAYKRYQPRESKVESEPKKERSPITVRISDVQREEVSWLWNHRIPRGKLTFIDGDPGEGKSFLSLALATAITRGFGLPGEKEPREPETVLIMNAEDGLADTIRPRLEDMGADISRVVALRGLTDEEGQERSLTLADLDVIEKAIVEHRPALVIVDPIIAYVAGKDTHRANEVRGLLAPLAALAEKYKCAILAIRHLNKGTSKAAYRGQGSIDFLAACRSAFLAGEDPENPGQKVLCHIKANLGPKTPSLTYTINEGRFLWGGESDITAEQVLADQAGGEERNLLEDAKRFLRDLLRDGPLPSSEVKRQAKEAGIAERTVWRAKTTLGVKAVKGGFEGGWKWSLPPEACQESPKRAKNHGVAEMAALGKLGSLGENEKGWEEIS